MSKNYQMRISYVQKSVTKWYLLNLVGVSYYIVSIHDKSYFIAIIVIRVK